ncbi:NUMOD4 motif-containing protein [Williamsia deligens]|nr:NUMOD4 motif-containing protein [Williamsia deligens]
MFAEEAKKRQGARTDIQETLPECKPQASDEAGDLFQVSGRSVRDAKFVAENDPETFENPPTPDNLTPAQLTAGGGLVVYLEMSMTEQWATVPNFPRYEVSTRGRVRRGDRILTPRCRNGGRAEVCLSRDSGGRSFQAVARLVLTAHTGPCPSGRLALHLDGDPTNNDHNNLRWGTHADRERLKSRHGRSLAQQTRCRSGRHEMTPENTYWTPQLTRLCRACQDDRKRPQIDSPEPGRTNTPDAPKRPAGSN